MFPIQAFLARLRWGALLDSEAVTEADSKKAALASISEGAAKRAALESHGVFRNSEQVDDLQPRDFLF